MNKNDFFTKSKTSFSNKFSILEILWVSLFFILMSGSIQIQGQIYVSDGAQIFNEGQIVSGKIIHESETDQESLISAKTLPREQLNEQTITSKNGSSKATKIKFKNDGQAFQKKLKKLTVKYTPKVSTEESGTFASNPKNQNTVALGSSNSTYFGTIITQVGLPLRTHFEEKTTRIIFNSQPFSNWTIQTNSIRPPPFLV